MPELTIDSALAQADADIIRINCVRNTDIAVPEPEDEHDKQAAGQNGIG